MHFVQETGPGSHFLGSRHTLRHLETAFFMPQLADHNAHEQWLADGATDANTRGLERARSLLADYEPPSLDPRVDEAMLAFIKQRKSELPDNVT